MIITYEGVEFVKITQGDLTVALNPVSKKSKLRGSNFGADVCLITLNHPDMNGIESVTRGDKVPFTAKGPGEYEVNGLFIEGFLSKSTYGGKEKYNTVYAFELDNIKVAFFGALGETDLSPKMKEELGDIDVIFVPIGSDGVLDPQEAYNLAVKREPKVIIPIHFGQIGEKDALKKFLKEAGAEDVKTVDKLTIKSKDLAEKKGEVVVLKPLN